MINDFGLCCESVKSWQYIFKDKPPLNYHANREGKKHFKRWFEG